MPEYTLQDGEGTKVVEVGSPDFTAQTDLYFDDLGDATLTATDKVAVQQGTSTPKKSTLTALWTFFWTLVVASSAKATPIDADSIPLTDSAASNVQKTVTFANLWIWIKSKLTGYKLDDLATCDDNTDLNATTLNHGLLPKLSGVATQFMDGAGAWAAATLSLDPSPTLTAALDAGSNRLTNVGTPTAGSDATTKTYVDAGDAALASAASIALALKLDLAGGTMTGPMAMGDYGITGLGELTAKDEATTAIASDAATLSSMVTTLQAESGTADDLTDLPTATGFRLLRADAGDTITVPDHGSDVANKIRTSDGSSLVLAENAWALLYRKTTSQVWRMVGGSGAGGGSSVLNNYAATVAPTTSNNFAGGYEVGSTWIDTVLGSVWGCVGDGVWTLLSAAPPVDSQTITGSNVTDVTFDVSANPLTPGDSFELEFSIVSPSSASDLYLFFNGDVTAASSYSQVNGLAGVANNPVRYNYPDFAYVDAAGVTRGRVRITLDSDGTANWHSFTSRKSGAGIEAFNSWGAKTTPLSPATIETIVVTSAVALQIGIGSWFTLRRLGSAGQTVTGGTGDLNLPAMWQFPAGDMIPDETGGYLDRVTGSNSKYYRNQMAVSDKITLADRMTGDLTNVVTVRFRYSVVAVTAAASKFINLTYNELARSSGEQEDTAYVAHSLGDIAMDATQGEPTTAYTDVSLATLGWGSYEVVRHNLTRAAAAGSELSGNAGLRLVAVEFRGA